MLIRILIGIALFMWVLMAPLPYRLSLMQSDGMQTHEAEIAKQEFFARKAVDKTAMLPLSDRKRKDALRQYAQVEWQKQNYSEATKVYRALLANAKPDNKRYDEEFAQDERAMANLSRDQNDFVNAKSYFQSAFTYDKNLLPKDDPRLARDLNNLGLQTYIEATSKDDKTEREKLMQESNHYFEEAVNIYAKDPKLENALATVLDNQYLVLRDLGEKDRALAVKAKSEAIEKRIPRLCQAP
jgi:tetratricopeptide (TPR) repeat protein